MSNGNTLAFHTPPVSDSWPAEKGAEHATRESYGLQDAQPDQALEQALSESINSSVSKPNSPQPPIIDVQGQSKPPKSTRRLSDVSKTQLAPKTEPQDHQSHHSEHEPLPATFDRMVDRFLRELQEPRYTAPLSANDISHLFQSFYGQVEQRAEEHVRGLSRFSESFSTHSRRDQPLETFDEMAERKKERQDRAAKVRKLVEATEASACDRVYDKIFCLSYSESDRKINDWIQSRVRALGQIPLTMKGLAPELEHANAESLKLRLKDAADCFQSMHGARHSRAKIAHLLRAHRVIVSALSDNLANDKSASADLILPALLYTIITYDVPDLWLNLRFITRFRNQRFLAGEDLYCVTNFEASVEFLQTLTLDVVGLTPDDLPAGVDPTLFKAPLLPPQVSALASRSRSNSRGSASSRRLSFHPGEIASTADQSFRTLGSTFGNSYRYLVGKLSTSDTKGTDRFPTTLEDAQRVLESSASSTSSASAGAGGAGGGAENDMAEPATLTPAPGLTPPPLPTAPRPPVRTLSETNIPLALNQDTDFRRMRSKSSESGASATFMGMIRSLRPSTLSEETTVPLPAVDELKFAPVNDRLLNPDTDALTVADLRTVHQDYIKLVEQLRASGLM